jgi:hypothetical protein
VRDRIHILVIDDMVQVCAGPKGSCCYREQDVAFFDSGPLPQVLDALDTDRVRRRRERQ